MTKAHHLAALAAAGEMAWLTAEGRVLLLTGQSRLSRSPLSPAQDQFLTDVTPKGFEAVRAGLPYLPVAMESPPDLLTASLANARQFLWIRSQPAYAAAVAGALSPILAASRSAMIVTGSMGLALLQAVWRRLPHLASGRLAIVCLGPAGAAPAFGPGVIVEVVQGVHDRWSRALYAGPVTRRVACGHLGYWRNEDARQVARSAAARLIGGSEA